MASLRSARALARSRAYRRRVRAGQCGRCGAHVELGRGTCDGCVAQVNAAMAARLARGKCKWCTNDVARPGASWCSPCNDRRNADHRAAYAAKRGGLKKPQRCRRCGADDHNAKSCKAARAHI